MSLKSPPLCNPIVHGLRGAARLCDACAVRIEAAYRGAGEAGAHRAAICTCLVHLCQDRNDGADGGMQQ